MAKIDTQIARSKLSQYLQPGEELLHVAYGVRPPPILAIVLLVIFTLGIGAVIAAHAMTKHYIVGVTRSRLLLLRVQAFGFNPVECTSIALNKATQVRADAGMIFVRLEFSDQGVAHFLKFHRAAFSGNREGALGIGQALQAGASAPDPGTHQALAPAAPGVGAAVMVRWADGAEYPAVLAAVHGDQVLCRFPNGSENWVGASFVRSATPAAAAPGFAGAPALVPSASAVRLPTQSHAIVGVVIGVLAVAVTVGLTLYRFLFSDLPFELLLSEGGLLSLRGIFMLAVEGIGAGSVAALLSMLISLSNPAVRGALVGGMSYLGKIVAVGVVVSLLNGGEHFIERTVGALVRILTHPSALTLLFLIVFAAVGAAVMSVLHKQVGEAQRA